MTYACTSEKAYHSRECPFNVGTLFPTAAGAASISPAPASPGSKCGAHRLGTGDARGVGCLYWSGLGRMQSQTQGLSTGPTPVIWPQRRSYLKISRCPETA